MKSILLIFYISCGPLYLMDFAVSEFLHAIYCKNESLVQKYIENGFDVNCQNSQGKSPLSQAAEAGSYAICKMLIESGAQVNSLDNECWAPIHRAVYGGYKDIVTLLLKNSMHMKLEGIPRLKELCLQSILQHEKIDSEIVQDLNQKIDPSPEIWLLATMKKILLQETKQRGNCLQIAHDENYKELHAYLLSIMDAQKLEDFANGSLCHTQNN